MHLNRQLPQQRTCLSFPGQVIRISEDELSVPTIDKQDVELALEDEANNLFDAVDTDGSGGIDVAEAARYFGLMVRADGEMPTEREARDIAIAAIDFADEDRDHVLSKREFASALVTQIAEELVRFLVVAV